MTDQEINEAVARKLGYVWGDKDILGSPRPDYCHSIAAAWEIVEKMRSENYSISIHTIDNGEWCIQFVGNEMTTWEDQTADTAPRAICLAFLKMT